MAKCAKCRAITTTGRRCRKDAIDGSDYCAVHQPVEQATVAPEPQDAAGAVASAERVVHTPPATKPPTVQVAPATVAEVGVRDVVGLYGAPAQEITSGNGTKVRVRTRESLSKWGAVGANYADTPPCQDDDS